MKSNMIIAHSSEGRFTHIGCAEEKIERKEEGEMWAWSTECPTTREVGDRRDQGSMSDAILTPVLQCLVAL